MGTDLSTSVPGVFAAGNLLHAVETADVAALDGRAVASGVLGHLAARGDTPPSRRLVPLRVSEPLAWVAPNLVSAVAAAPPRGHFVLWSAAVIPSPRSPWSRTAACCTGRSGRARCCRGGRGISRRTGCPAWTTPAGPFGCARNPSDGRR
nr:hypothetical protein [Streptomyces sp. LBUM 1481]